MIAHARRLAAAFSASSRPAPRLALNLCVEGAYPPFSEVAPDGSIVGFDIDIGHGALQADGRDLRRW